MDDRERKLDVKPLCAMGQCCDKRRRVPSALRRGKRDENIDDFWEICSDMAAAATELEAAAGEMQAREEPAAV
jgi:hypothetical protein